MVEIYHWHTEPLLVGGLVLSIWIYALCTGPWRNIIAGKELAYPKQEAIWFYSGMLAFYITVGSPIDAIGEGFLLSVHMLQHLLLMYACPPLIILGLNGSLIDALLKRFRALEWVLRFCLKPWVCGLCLTSIFTIWHVPDLYEAALRNKTIHILEHLSIFFPSLMIWWLVFSKSKRLPATGVGSQVILMIALAVAQTPVFAYMVFAGRAVYPTYEFAPRLLEITPLADQALAGVVMKIGNLIVVLSILGRAMYHWSNGETPSQPKSDQG